MQTAQVIHGTSEQILDHLKTLSRKTHLTLIVPNEDDSDEAPSNLHHASPEDRARALDEIARLNHDVPVLPAEAYNRESLYENEA
jgi:hypothetical protein